jgi:phosphoribosyl 1,2-cyclic phosphate phosphodiesterase
MRITFLGTGTSQGIPVIGCTCQVCNSDDPRNQRLRTSVWVETDQQSILIDIGPDFRQQALLHGITRIDAILLTHEHADHTAGMDDIRPINFAMDRKIPLYAEGHTIQDLKQRFYYIFGPNEYPGLPQLELIEITPNQPFTIGEDPILPFRVIHGRMRIVGFKLNQFVYITDASHLDSAEIELIKNCDCLVVNSLRHKTHHSHFNLDQALELVNQVKPKRAYLTHLSHQMGSHAETEKTLTDTIRLAYDGLQIHLLS